MDPNTSPPGVLPGEPEDQLTHIRVDRGPPWGLALLGTIKLLGHELAVPGQDRVWLDEARHFRQGLLPQLLTDLGQRRAFAVRQPHTAQR